MVLWLIILIVLFVGCLLEFTFILYFKKNMSVIGRREWASNEKAYKYEFSLEILKCTCELPLPCTLRFSFKRNSRGIETKNAFEGKPGYNEMTINQKLSSLSTILYNTETKTFLSKEAQIIVNMYFNGAPKKLASCQLDMRSILDPKDIKASRSQTFETELTRCISQNSGCRLTYRFSCTFKEEIVPSEKSIGGPLNTSGFSMQQDKYFEKKYEVPSKDNHSVNSYAGNRYPSASKRDDSSVRKFDYGYLAGLKSNISNQVSQEYDINSDMKSRDNKTEMNDGNYINRQLIDEQNKRSKAEAELARNKVEISELKKKINELSIQNMKIKEQVKMVAGSKNSVSQQQVNSLQFKVYELNNQLRDLKNQLEAKKREGERWENQCARMKSEKNVFQNEAMERQKKLEQLQRNQTNNNRGVQNLQNENSDLKYQIQNLRRYIQQLKKQYADQQGRLRTEQFRESQQMKTQLDYLRKQNEKMRSKNDITEQQQKKINEYQERLKERTNQMYIKNRNLQELEREVEEYKGRLNQYESEKSSMNREIIRMKQESNDRSQGDKKRQEIQAKAEWLTSENHRINQDLRYYQTQLDEAHQNIQKMKSEQGQSQGRSAKLLPQINQLQKKVNEFQVENGMLRTQKAELIKQKEDLQREVQGMREDMFKSTASTTTNPEVQRLFRESLQMQVDLKFANDELARLRGLQQAFQNEKWRAEKEYNDRVQLQKEFQRIEKELVNKNRALMIEVEKSKMLSEQIGQQLGTINFYKDELEKNRGIIYNMEQQLNDLSMLSNNQKQECQRLQQQNTVLRTERSKWSGLQEKVKELESRNNEKVETLETLNRNLLMAKGEIKDLQERNQELHKELVSRDKSQYDVQSRLREMEKQRATWQSDISKLSQEKRTLEKRNDMIVQQMHVMKKRFEEEKGRSLSFTRNEEFNKVRTLQSQVQKKEKAISKLNKQKLQLQEQNVKINVQVMKLLSQLQKLKATSSYSQTSSYKTIGGTTLK